MNGTRRIRTALALSAAALAAAAAGCGTGTPRTVAKSVPAAGTSSSPAPPAAPRRLVASVSSLRLPAPLSGEAVAARPGGGLLVAGGLDAADASTQAVLELGPRGGFRQAGTLAAPLHDAAAATLGDRTLVIGGGSATTVDTVQELSPGAAASVVGHLPGPRSDLAAATLGGRAYVLGGFDGSTPAASVLETADGTAFRQIAVLPATARYGAVAALGRTIYAFGGETATGGDSAAIQAVDVRRRSAKIVGHLPEGLSHASAVVLGGRIYVLGGRAGGKAGDRIVRFDPATRRASFAGHLPLAVTNAAATTSAGTGYLLGGLGSDGTALRSVVTLRLR